MGRSYVRRGVTPPPNWVPKKGDVVYVEGVKTKIARTGVSDGVDYVWFRPHVRGTIAMSVRNLKQVAYVDADLKSNPASSIPSKWTPALVRKTGSRIQLKVHTRSGAGRKRR